MEPLHLQEKAGGWKGEKTLRGRGCGVGSLAPMRPQTGRGRPPIPWRTAAGLMEGGSMAMHSHRPDRGPVEAAGGKARAWPAWSEDVNVNKRPEFTLNVAA